MLFSATLSYRVQELAFEHMNNPEHVVVEPDQNRSSHSGKAVLPIERTPDGAATDSYRRRVARSRNHFANTKHRCEQIWVHLAADNHRVGLLTGDVPQKNVCVF